MNTRQNIEYSVFQQILLFLLVYIESFTDNKQLQDAIVKFKGDINKIDGVSAKKQLKATVPKTKMKTAARKGVVSKLEASCLLALEYAKTQKNEQLIKDFTIHISNFSGKINSMIRLSKYTYGVLEANKVALIAATPITALQLTAIETEIELLQTLQQAPSAERNTQRTVTALYLPAFVDATASKKSLINLINGGYTIGDNSNKQLILDLSNALVFGGNVHHTILTCKFLNLESSIPIEGGMMTITELSRVGRSNIFGIAQISEFIPGAFHVVFSALGYVTQTQILTITAGEKVNLTVKLVED